MKDSVHQPNWFWIAAMSVWLALGVLMFWLTRTTHPGVPFIWGDLAIVHCVCALPLARIIVDRLSRQTVCRMSVLLIAIATGFVVTSLSARQMLPQRWMSGYSGYALRELIALNFGLVLMGLWDLSRVQTPGESTIARRQLVVWTLVTVAMCALPSVYLAARCRHDVERVQELVGQARWGEAQTLGQRLMILDPELQAGAQPLRRMMIMIDLRVRDLRANVAAAPRTFESDMDRLNHARQLAMLGETAQALLTLAPLEERVPAALLLAATIHENHGEWKEALREYRGAQQTGKTLPIVTDADRELIQATTGEAYCLRKLGRYRDAGVAYRRLLDLAPTADTHLLLARFYEESRQTAEARKHARLAMQLGGDRMESASQQLVDTLNTSHFGCLGDLFRSALEGTAQPSMPVEKLLP